MGCLPPLVVVVLALLGWSIYAGRVNTQLAQIQNEIRARGEPLTAKELAALHSLPAGETDKTALLLAIIAKIETEEFEQAAMELPLVGHGEDPPASLSDDWPEHDQVRAFLQDQAELLAEIESAALAPGEVRFSIAFEEHAWAASDYLQFIRIASRMLWLKALSAAVNGDDDLAFQSIHGMYELARSIESEPVLLSQLHLASRHESASEAISQCLPHTDWTDEQLQQLIDHCLRRDWRDNLRLGLLGERAFGELILTDPEVLANDGWNETLVADDRRFQLEYWTEMLDLVELEFPEIEQEALRMNEELDAEFETKTQFRIYSMQMLIAPTGVTRSFAQAQARDRATAVQLAIERYRKQHGKRPETIEQLTPDFLPEVPVDPFNGEPLRYIAGPEETLVYSVGPNMKDDGGDYESLVQGDGGYPYPDDVVHVDEPPKP